jgi:hypothetical protein
VITANPTDHRSSSPTSEPTTNPTSERTFEPTVTLLANRQSCHCQAFKADDQPTIELLVEASSSSSIEPTAKPSILPTSKYTVKHMCLLTLYSTTKS